MRILLSMLVLLALTSCVSAPPPPPPVRREAPARVVAPPLPVPLASDWRDWPQTPGDWSYAHSGARSRAVFGAGERPLFSVICDAPTRSVLLGSYAPGALTVRTTSLNRMLTASSSTTNPSVFEASVPATDPLLDAIGFSRGRFVVEQPGRPPLVLPAWAEVERVVEDCRS